MPRPEVMGHMLAGPNLALIIPRRVETQGPWQHVSVATHLVEHVAVSLKTIDLVLPLYVYAQQRFGRNRQTSIFDTAGPEAKDNRVPNLTASVVKLISQQLDIEYQSFGTGDLRASFAPEDVVRYSYAILHSPTYRARYAEFLKIDFPRVPLTSSLDLFRGLAMLGGELVALHLMESPALAQHITTYTGPAAPTVEKVTYADGTVWLDKAQTVGFRGVPEAVWDFHIGGYQVCEKWLKDRKGRTLSAEEIAHYQRVVVALNETIRIMREIDEVIEDHGGWPIQ